MYSLVPMQRTKCFVVGNSYCLYLNSHIEQSTNPWYTYYWIQQLLQRILWTSIIGFVIQCLALYCDTSDKIRLAIDGIPEQAEATL